MSARIAGGFVKLTVLVVLMLFLFLVLNSSVERNDPSEILIKQETTPIPIDFSIDPINEQLLHKLGQELPEVDFDFFYNYAKPQKYKSNCSVYPDPLDLQLHNIYWQTFNNANITFRLFAAYMDRRKGVNSTQGLVRILATANQINRTFPSTHCLLWFENQMQPIEVEVNNYISPWYYKWGTKPLVSYPHLLSCPMPDALPLHLEGSIPRTVSLVSPNCEQQISNTLRVNYLLPKGEDPSPNSGRDSFTESSTLSNTDEPRLSNDTGFSNQPIVDSDSTLSLKSPVSIGVCLKGFDFPYEDKSQRLIEWFELHRLIGASRIYAYIYDVHPAMKKVLDYYQRIGYLKLRPLTMANGLPRLRNFHHLLLKHRMLVRRLNELIPYNDCFYRNMYRHDYMLNVDVDEVIMPVGELRNWQQVLERELETTKIDCLNAYVSICFLNSYFTKVIPDELQQEKLYVLQHTQRFVNYSAVGIATKCFHNTRYAVTLHNHHALNALPGNCRKRHVNITLAQMHHYREPDKKYELSDLVEDRNVWRFEEELRQAVGYVQLHLDEN